MLKKAIPEKRISCTACFINATCVHPKERKMQYEKTGVTTHCRLIPVRPQRPKIRRGSNA